VINKATDSQLTVPQPFLIRCCFFKKKFGLTKTITHCHHKYINQINQSSRTTRAVNILWF